MTEAVYSNISKVKVVNKTKRINLLKDPLENLNFTLSELTKKKLDTYRYKVLANLKYGKG